MKKVTDWKKFGFSYDGNLALFFVQKTIKHVQAQKFLISLQNFDQFWVSQKSPKNELKLK